MVRALVRQNVCTRAGRTVRGRDLRADGDDRIAATASEATVVRIVYSNVGGCLSVQVAHRLLTQLLGQRARSPAAARSQPMLDHRTISQETCRHRCVQQTPTQAPVGPHRRLCSRA